MDIRERLMVVGGTEKSPTMENNFYSPVYQKLKYQLHQLLLEKIDLEKLQNLSTEQFKREISSLVDQISEEEKLMVNQVERRQLAIDMQYEMLGFGPIEPLMADPTVSDILVNTFSKIYVERRGRLELTPVTFNDNAHLLKVIEKIVSRIGRRIDESSPMVDARLPDGSRVNAIIPPLAIDGPILSIRRFSVQPLSITDLINYKSVNQSIATLLAALAKSKINILISGGTGSGKTTLLNVISGFIPADERIVTIEDAAELQLQQPHVVRLETKPANIEGKGEVTQRALVKNSLRMRPDRIILGEVRGGEALDMLQAMNTGHEGSLATIHANSPRDALSRLENMVGMANTNLSPRAVRQQIAAAIAVVIQIMRFPDGTRKLLSLQEVTGMEGDTICMQEIFVFKRNGVDKEGHVLGHFMPTGIFPKFDQRLKEFGVTLPESLFHDGDDADEHQQITSQITL
jgi:pilus assembly protein CpaF